MPYCPECGEEVPEDGRFCPACGVDTGHGHGHQPGHGAHGATQQQTPGQNRQQPRGQRRQGPTGNTAQGWNDPRGAPQQPPGGYPPQTPGARAADHGLLLGTVVIIAGIALLEGTAKVFFAATIVEESSFGEMITPELLQIFSVLLILGALGAIATTAYFYRDGTLNKTYFGILLGLGVFGFMFGGSIILTLLSLVGIYGFIVVLD